MHEENLFIGRSEEMRLLHDAIKSRGRMHLHGPAGSGKTALLCHLLERWDEMPNPPAPVYCRDSVTLREILVSLSAFLLGRFKHLSGLDKYREPIELGATNDVNDTNIVNLRNIVYHYLKKGDFCIILDHLEDVTPRINSLLTALYGCATVITASRQSRDTPGRRVYALWLVPKLRVGNLCKDDAFLLMESLHGSLYSKVRDKLRLFKDIYEIYQGNPKMIKTIFAKAADPRYLHDGKLNLNLIVIDCRMDEVRMP